MPAGAQQQESCSERRRRPARGPLRAAAGLLLLGLHLWAASLAAAAAAQQAASAAAPDGEAAPEAEANNRSPAAGEPATLCREASQPTADGSQEAALEDLTNKSDGLAEQQVSAYARPTFYTLRLKTDPLKQKFTGQLMIALNISAPDAATTAPPGSESPAEPGHRYLSLNAGLNIRTTRAFYVYKSSKGLQIPATRIGRQGELITLDFHPNLITAGQGMLLLVYSGQVNETDSQGLFVHHSQRAGGWSKWSGGRLLDAGLATHMQPTFARRLLPCWDQPQYKARFSLIVVLPFRGYEAISNTPIKRKSISLNCVGEPTQEIEFQTSPLMSSYLLTLVVGQFDYLEAYTASNCRLRVYFYANVTDGTGAVGEPEAAPGSGPRQRKKGEPPAAAGAAKVQHLIRHQPANERRKNAELALKVALGTLNRLEELFNVKYPLAKLDLIALRSFQGGGMENWGAALFHENYLLYDASGAAEIQVNGGRSRAKPVVLPLVVAHELAHQWFGNLVTAGSWKYLWLNEGFAQWLMYDIGQHLYPAHGYWRVYVEDSRLSALHDDELLASSHSLEPQADNGQSLEEAASNLSLFDQITYNKGAQLVGQLHHMLGRPLFLAGLRLYLTRNAYKSVGSGHLWRAFEEAARLPEGRLESLMQGWCAHDGYPLLTVRAHEEPASWRLRISQQRFTLLPGARDEPAPAASGLWQVPVSVSGELAPRPSARDILVNLQAGAGQPISACTFILGEPSALISLPRSALGAWLKLNYNATGFYRVNYQLALQPDGSPAPAPAPASGGRPEVDLLHRMAPAVRAKRMGSLDRYNLIDDLFAVTRAGHKPTAYYLRYLLEAYSAELDPMVLGTITQALARLRLLLSNDERQLAELFERWARLYLERLRSQLNRRLRDPNLAERHAGPLRESEQLIESQQLRFNDPEALARAQLLFGQLRFRQDEPAPGEGGGGRRQWAPDREFRAAVYAAALAASERRAEPPDAAGSNQTSEPRQLFEELLEAYQSSDSGAERHAISSALGSTRDPARQLHILNLTLSGYHFRPHDAQAALEALAQSAPGRQLLWAQLQPHSLESLLRALEPGLVEPEETPSGGPLEQQLRALYGRLSGQHGRLISHSIELLLINSHWFQRDRRGLLAYLSPTVPWPEPAAASSRRRR